MRQKTQQPQVVYVSSVAVLLLSTLACGPGRPPDDRSAPSPDPALSAPGGSPGANAIVIAGPKNIAMLPIIADKRGLFGQVGVMARFEPLQTGKLAMDAVVAGQVDLGILVDTNVAHVMFQEGVDLAVLCSVMEKEDDALVFRADHGVSRPRDLAGKTVAYVPATTSDSFLWRFLRKHTLGPREVTLFPTTPPALQAAVIKGDVDAAAIWQPWRANILKELDKRGGEARNEGVYRAYAVLAVRRTTIDRRARELQEVLRALIAAEQYVEQHSQEARALLADEIPIDPSILEASWSEYRPRVALTRGLLVNLNEEGEHLRQFQSEFKGKAQPLYTAALRSEVLSVVAPERVEPLGPAPR